MRRSVTALALTLLSIALLWGLAMAGPAAAQTQPPAPTPPALTPTPTQTLPELVGAGQQADWLAEAWARYGWWTLLALLVAGALYLLSGYGEGLREWFKKLGERHAEQPFKAAEEAQQRHEQAAAQKSATTIYLEWLRAEESLCYLPIIPIEKRQEQLLLEEVYVPLRVVERQQIEGFRRLTLGDFDPGGEYRLRQEAFEALQNSQRVYRLLSDPELLARAEEPPRPRQSRRPPPAGQHELPHTASRLLIIGDAGSGKTSTLHYGALALARDGLAGSSEAARERLGLYLPRPPLPLYVRLTLVATYVRERFRRAAAGDLPELDQAPAALLLGWLDGYLYAQAEGRLPQDFASTAVRAGGCLLLLDGLDETGDAAERDYMQRLIVNLSRAYPRNRFLVASRPYDGLHLLDFADYHLSPLSRDEIALLLSNWFTAIRDQPATARAGAPPKHSEEVDYLLGILDDSPRLFEMATNPLLLTTMALLIHGGATLPRERAELYHRLVPLLLRQWREAQVGGGKPPGQQSDLALFEKESPTSIQRRLQDMAAWMQEQQRREIRLAEAQQVLRPIYRDLMRAQGWNDEQCDDHVARLLGSLELHSGLIQGRDRGYSFAHYTLQEYLTARSYDLRADGAARLLARRDEARWRETILLAVGHWATQGLPERAQELLGALLDTGELRALQLVAAALDDADAGRVPELALLRDRTVERLRAAAFDPAACPAPAQRAACAGLLDRLGADDRPALDPASPEFWAERIAPGAFVIGPGYRQEVKSDSGKGGIEIIEVEDPAFTCHIRRPYALARFPVTNRLYLRFLEALEARGDAGQKEAAARRPRGWPGRRYRAGEGAHPVVNVRWDDACAFAAWADEALLTDEQRAAGEAIRLPTEPEWERAAAYPAFVPPGQPGLGRREYPWGAWPEGLTDTGDDSIKAAIRASTGESDLNGTTPVGIFPHGAAACGAEELAGNVWEWCATAYREYPLPDDLDAETVYTSEDWQGRTYVLRGGSWAYGRSNARCGARTRLNPGPVLVLVSLGFRVARLFSSGRS